MKECPLIDGELNVYDEPLEVCSCSPVTGYTREGSCVMEDFDLGVHTICAVITEEFLRFSLVRGNDLSTPRPEWGFPGVKAGERWCLCASRWIEAHEDGVAPPVILRATSKKTLNFIPLETLERYALRE